MRFVKTPWLYPCLFVLCLFPLFLFARKGKMLSEFPPKEVPWLTGPLLTPSASVTRIGHINIAPYFYSIAETGAYDNRGKAHALAHTFWTNIAQANLQVGLTSWMDVDVAPAALYNRSGHAANWAFGDLPLGLDFQLFSPPHSRSPIPYLLFSVTEIFPTGKYDHLNPKELETQAGGLGSFQTVFDLILGKLWHFGGISFTTTRLALQYSLAAPLHVKGFNVYGGGYGTDARIRSVHRFELALGIEKTLGRHWALASDFLAIWTGSIRYRGSPGQIIEGVSAPLGSRAGYQISFAPAIEYNWTSKLGAIGGGWFTAWGKNAARFWGLVFAVNYFI